VFALKSGDKQESKQLGKKGGKGKGEKYLNILKNALKEPELRLIVVERLVLEGTYSIGDAAVNAILFGILIILWQILIIYLSENYKLEHESFRFKPDFQSDRNNFKFHVTLRAAIYKIVWLILKHTIKTHRANGKEFNKTEYFYT